MARDHRGDQPHLDSHETHIEISGNKIGHVFIACALAVNGMTLYGIFLSALFIGVFWIKFPSDFYAIVHDSVTTAAGLFHLFMWLVLVSCFGLIGGLILTKLFIPALGDIKEIFRPSPKVHAITEHMAVYSGALTVHDHQDDKTVENYKIDVAKLAEQQVLPPPQLTLPPACTRLDALRRAHHELALDNLFLGLGKGGAVKACTLDGFMHVAHDGPTNGGKSSQAYGEMVDLLKLGIHIILLNPHFAPIEKKSGRDWRPIARAIEHQGLLTLAPGLQLFGLIRRMENIVRMLLWLTEKELPRRLDLRARGDFSYEPLYLFIDEWPAIVQVWKEAALHKAAILRQGRSLEVYVNTNSQGFLTDDVQLAGSARENFATAFHMGGSPHSGSRLLDLPVKEYNALLKNEQVTLGKGIALLRNNETVPQAEVVRLPYADNDYAYYLLGRADEWILPELRRSSPVVPEAVPPEQTEHQFRQDGKQQELDIGKLTRLRDMVLRGASQNEITDSLFAGMRRADALQEYRKYLAALVSRPSDTVSSKEEANA